MSDNQNKTFQKDGNCEEPNNLMNNQRNKVFQKDGNWNQPNYWKGSQQKDGNCAQPDFNSCKRDTDTRDDYHYQKNKNQKQRIPKRNSPYGPIRSENIFEFFNTSGN